MDACIPFVSHFALSALFRVISLQTAAKEQAKKHGVHLTQSPAFAASFQSLLEKSFPYKTIADAQAAFSTRIDHNDELWSAVIATQTVLSTAVANVQGLEHYIQMHIPKMEDGGNFGVTIQLQALKEMQDTREKWIKNVEELSKYASARADAMDKLGLPNAIQTETTTQSASQVVGGKEGDEQKTSTTTTQEKKTTSTVAANFYRQQAVVGVDLYYYTLAQNAVASVRNGYLAILDFIEKNQDKLENPRGTSGGSSYHSMY